MVRAKFRVNAVTSTEGSRVKKDAAGNVVKKANGYEEYEPCEMRTISMSPVYGNGDPNHENTKFWQASPTGNLELGCVNLAAAEQFKLGQEFYVDFTPAP